MKTTWNLTLSLLALTLTHTSAASLAGLFTQQHRDWNFIQAVGGMKVTLVEQRLDVACDVSGLQTITVKPTQVNSAMGVRKLTCTRRDGILHLSLVTSVIEKGMKPDAGSVDLSAYPAGSYAVVYLDPDGTTHPLGNIQLP